MGGSRGCSPSGDHSAAGQPAGGAARGALKSRRACPRPGPRPMQFAVRLGTRTSVTSYQRRSLSKRARQRWRPASDCETIADWCRRSPSKYPLEAQFTLMRGSMRVQGGLRLRRPEDPLSLHLDAPAPEALIGEAWAAALILYAELTCADLLAGEPVDPRPTHPPVTFHRARPRPTAERTIRRTGTGRSRTVPTDIAATLRDAVERIQSVSGHVRRLPPGSKPSDTARRATEQAGIRLPGAVPGCGPSIAATRSGSASHGPATRGSGKRTLRTSNYASHQRSPSITTSPSSRSWQRSAMRLPAPPTRSS